MAKRQNRTYLDTRLATQRLGIITFSRGLNPIANEHFTSTTELSAHHK